MTGRPHYGDGISGAIMKAFAALLIVCALAACEGTLGETLTVREAKPAVAALLKDPSSAQFDSIQAIGSCVTGKVNAKNEFGGYTGFVEFKYNAVSKAAAIDPGALVPIRSETDLARNAGVTGYAEFASQCAADAAHEGQ